MSEANTFQNRVHSGAGEKYVSLCKHWTAPIGYIPSQTHSQMSYKFWW